MKAAIWGRLLFGAAAVLLGVIALLWHDAATWQNLRHLWSLPFGAFIGAALMAAQIAAGIVLQHPRSARTASLTLCAVYACFSLSCLPDVFTAADIYDRLGGSFFLFLAMAWGALALYAASDANPVRAAALNRAARRGLGICAISFTLGQALLLRQTAQSVPRWIPPSPMFWASLTTLAFALAALALLAGRHARLAAHLMALMLALFGLLVWIPAIVAHPGAHFNWSELAETLLASGAAAVIAGAAQFPAPRPRFPVPLKTLAPASKTTGAHRA